jgi:NADH-quinone oxidoreductase subunit J
MEILHGLLCLLLVSSGFFVSFSKNPVESVLFLILTFCNAAAILFIFNSEFLGLLFIIIYVGAIAVLFLFVVMMLNVKNQDPSQDLFLLRQGGLFNLLFLLLSYIVCIAIYLAIGKAFLSSASLVDVSNSSVFSVYDSLTNIEVMGQSLYNHYLICFILAGLILLIALVGSIVLTLRYSSRQKNQLISRQLSRTDSFLSFFK